MKTFVSLLLMTVCSVNLFSQTVWIADNRPSAPTGAHIFADVASAIAAASPGDIIHLTPSQFSYGNWTINKDSLTFFGIGYNPNKEQPAIVINGTITINENIFGIRLSGINASQISLGNTSNGSIGNILIENGEIDAITGNFSFGSTNLSNIIIRNCVIGRDQTVGVHVINLEGSYVNSTSVIIANNVIMGTSSTAGGGYGAISATDAIIKNNLFLGNDTDDFAFNLVTTSTISNNIFLGRTPRTDAVTGNVTNVTFNNNISFGNSNNAFPVGSDGNTGNGNLEGTDPLLSGITVQDDWDFAFDPTPDTGSPAILGGNDGGDIGVTGGTIPYSTTGSPLPVIKVLRLPELIQEGTNVDATIEAEGN